MHLNLEDIRLLQRTFLQRFRSNTPSKVPAVKTVPLLGARGTAELFSMCDSLSFNDGLYRLHIVDQIDAWTAAAFEMFPELSSNIRCFAADWLGRQFALDPGRLVDGDPGVLLLEPGTGQILEIPANFLTFHAHELVECADSALARSAYLSWRELDSRPLAPSECMGYRVPLFLGGEDSLENMERTDMQVYWSLSGQLWSSVRDLPEGRTNYGDT